jgi:hypothetical protein
MTRRSKLADPVRSRLLEQIDIEVESAQMHIQLASDMADLLNALDTTGDKIEIDGNIVVGVFKKEAEAK